MAIAQGMKRFWTDVSHEPHGGGWRVLLDGRPIRTQRGGQPQVVLTRELAELLAAEWAAQGDTIDPEAFAMRDIADYAIDVVAAEPDGTIEKILGFAETDTLCYRADPDEPLWKHQQLVWEPVLAAFEAREGVALTRVSGIVHRAQPPATLAALRARLAALEPFTLAALETMTSLSTSLTVGLSALEPGADLAALWDAAELEEAWQVALWGSDAEAQDRRDKRAADFARAARFAAAVATTI